MIGLDGGWRADRPGPKSKARQQWRARSVYTGGGAFSDGVVAAPPPKGGGLAGVFVMTPSEDADEGGGATGGWVDSARATKNGN